MLNFSQILHDDDQRVGALDGGEGFVKEKYFYYNIKSPDKSKNRDLQVGNLQKLSWHACTNGINLISENVQKREYLSIILCMKDGLSDP